jgi:hypothetical protein
LTCRQPESVPERFGNDNAPGRIDGSPHAINLPYADA